MTKHFMITPVISIGLALLSGCASFSTLENVDAPNSASMDLELAEKVLLAYFDELSRGEYNSAAARYGGDLTLMSDSNPDVDSQDLPALFEAACTRQLQCLPVRTITQATQSTTETFTFRLEFSNRDGSLFVLGPCCGATETEMPPVSEFDCSVENTAESGFQVMCLPVYVP